jgi:tetratricopeptide (TPR) repeat protein
MQNLNSLKIILILIFVLFIQGSTFVIDPAKNAVRHNEKGLFCLRFGNYYGAIEEFKLAIALNHKSEASGAFYNNLGTTYYKLGVYEPASQCFQRAITFNPNFIQYQQNLIDTYKAQKKLNKVIKDYEKTVKKAPYNSRAHLMLGLMYKKINNKAKAVGHLSEFKRLEPDLAVTKQVDEMLREMR